MTEQKSAGWVCAVDTSTDICVGLANRDGWHGSWRIDDRRSHAEQLQALINTACAEQGITLMDVERHVVGVGPGPFTGLRVGIVTSRTLAALGDGFPRTVRVPKGVCSLDVLALQWVLGDTAPRGRFVVASDARRKELHWAQYDVSGQRIGRPQVSAPTSLPELPLIGSGADLYPEVLGDRIAVGPRWLDAGVMAAHIDDLQDAGSEPLYLRQPDASVATTRKSTLVRRRLSARRPS